MKKLIQSIVNRISRTDAQGIFYSFDSVMGHPAVMTSDSNGRSLNVIWGGDQISCPETSIALWEMAVIARQKFKVVVGCELDLRTIAEQVINEAIIVSTGLLPPNEIVPLRNLIDELYAAWSAAAK